MKLFVLVNFNYNAVINLFMRELVFTEENFGCFVHDKNSRSYKKFNLMGRPFYNI